MAGQSYGAPNHNRMGPWAVIGADVATAIWFIGNSIKLVVDLMGTTSSTDERWRLDELEKRLRLLEQDVSRSSSVSPTAQAQITEIARELDSKSHRTDPTGPYSPAENGKILYQAPPKGQYSPAEVGTEPYEMGQGGQYGQAEYGNTSYQAPPEEPYSQAEYRNTSHQAEPTRQYRQPGGGNTPYQAEPTRQDGQRRW
ncbi:MAG: hypothetical protein M1824_005632 [Vezdaea acicularis]|nr:MAG: hypothetical protein M1824_005632 [Vezdaea acicularis]